MTAIVDRVGRPIPDDILEALGLAPYEGRVRSRDLRRPGTPVTREPSDWFWPGNPSVPLLTNPSNGGLL